MVHHGVRRAHRFASRHTEPKCSSVDGASSQWHEVMQTTDTIILLKGMMTAKSERKTGKRRTRSFEVIRK